MHDVTAVVLAGGLGTRLRAVVSDRPKVLASVGGVAFIVHLLRRLSSAGIRRTVLCTGYLGDQIEAELGSRFEAMQLVYSREDAPLGTAGALRLASDRIDTPDALVLNGDTVCALDLQRFVTSQQGSGAPAAMAVVPSPRDGARYGTVEIDDNGRVRSFAEKSPHADGGWINAGVYLIPRSWLQELPSGRASSLERDALGQWQGRGISAYRTAVPFIDIGTPQSLTQAQQVLRRCESPRYVALDRDGTIIVERHYLSDPDHVQLLPATAAGLQRMGALGLRLIVVTNQSAVGRGIIDEARLAQIHERMRQLLADEGIRLDGVYYCPHTPDDDCNCRKPRPGLMLQAADELGFNPASAFVVGDKACDIDLGLGIGARTALVRTGYGARTESSGAAQPHWVVDDLLQAAAVIERDLQRAPLVPAEQRS